MAEFWPKYSKVNIHGCAISDLSKLSNSADRMPSLVKVCSEFTKMFIECWSFFLESGFSQRVAGGEGVVHSGAGVHGRRINVSSWAVRVNEGGTGSLAFCCVQPVC